MKKIICVLMLAILVVAFAGCTSRSADNLSGVKLCNLDEYSIDDSVFELSEEDLESVISAKISTMDLELNPEELSDEDMQIFGCNTVDEFKRETIEDIVYRRFVEEYYNHLLTNSVVEPSGREEEFINSVLENVSKAAAENGQSIDSILKENYQMNTDAFKEHLSGFWINMQIIFSYCDSQGLSCTEAELADVEDALKDSEEFRYYTANEKTKNELIRYFILDEKVQDYIAEKHAAEIEQYSEKLISDLIGA